ncbi:MAG: sporulation initiation inhibitor Soj [Denitrovibrio sp.]|nr:MAG: sporulation initiation inhibitor Soj [Denitrovibrio sp.]
MGKIIAIANQKGGVGKTTTAINLSSALGFAGAKVLVVDMDPQGNATSGLGVTLADNDVSIYEVLIGRADAKSTIRPTNVENLDIIPGNINLSAAEVELVTEMSRETKLKKVLRGVCDEYNFVMIDCPPSLGLLTVNSLTAADSVLIPLQCEYYAMEGLGQLLNTISLIKDSLNVDLQLEGILLTMFDPRNNLSKEVQKQVEEYLAESIFDTVIPRNVRLSEAPSFGQSIIEYDIKSKGAASYIELAKEMLARLP